MTRILFPVDFSDRCRAIMPMVKRMADGLGARITLLHCIHVPASFYALERAYPVTLDTEAMTQDAKEQLLHFFEAREGSVDAVASVGDAAAFIVEYARNNRMGLIMMATHGYGAFRSLLLGSVAAKVLHDAECAVWTAAHTEDPAILAHAECKNILCALDLREGSLELLRQGAAFASRFNARLRILHALSDALPGPDPDGSYYRELLLRNAREELERLQTQAGTALEYYIESGAVGPWVGEMAYHESADLVIIGRGRLHAKRGRLRTQSYAIIRDSPCPVLSF